MLSAQPRVVLALGERATRVDMDLTGERVAAGCFAGFAQVARFDAPF
jgi:hypothetical protein